MGEAGPDATAALAAPLWAPRAWIAGRWHDAVVLQAGADGHWEHIEAGVAAPAGAMRLAGPVVAGLVNGHSHAFQRAFAGLAERREGEHDDFWAWRDGMYRVALRLTAPQLRAIAAQLYVELLRGGYTHTCEFHYLHNDAAGRAYVPLAGAGLSMAEALVAGADAAGMGLTLLPAVYERAGFAQAQLHAEQRRFAADAAAVLDLRTALRALARTRGAGLPALQVGVALHSLRAATPQAIERLRRDEDAGPIHIHIAEQVREVDDCLRATGLRPIQWLLQHAAPDRRWHLVHATHATAAEIAGVAASGAGVVLCPSTEANLGDGVVDLPGWLDQGVAITLGSDSNVTRSGTEEVRLLEYSQRLLRRLRCVAAAPQHGAPSTAARLWTRVTEAGAAAAGLQRWGLQVGARADLLVVDTAASALLGIPAAHLLDAVVFSSPARPFRDVLVAGRWVVRNHHHGAAGAIATRFAAALGEVWEGE